jgi:hypothetical protein
MVLERIKQNKARRYTMGKEDFISVNTKEFWELSNQIGHYTACVLISFALSDILTLPPIFYNKSKCRRDELFKRIAAKLFNAQPTREMKRTAQAIETLVNEGYIRIKDTKNGMTVRLNWRKARYVLRKCNP